MLGNCIAMEFKWHSFHSLELRGVIVYYTRWHEGEVSWVSVVDCLTSWLREDGKEGIGTAYD